MLIIFVKYFVLLHKFHFIWMGWFAYWQTVPHQDGLVLNDIEPATTTSVESANKKQHIVDTCRHDNNVLFFNFEYYETRSTIRPICYTICAYVLHMYRWYLVTNDIKSSHPPIRWKTQQIVLTSHKVFPFILLQSDWHKSPENSLQQCQKVHSRECNIGKGLMYRSGHLQNCPKGI